MSEPAIDPKVTQVPLVTWEIIPGRDSDAERYTVALGFGGETSLNDNERVFDEMVEELRGILRAGGWI